MPRELFPAPAEPPSVKEQPLVASPESQTPTPTKPASFEDLHGAEQLEENDADSPEWIDDDENDTSKEFTTHRDASMRGGSSYLQHLRENRARSSEMDSLHPIVQTLSLRDLVSVLALEEACFPEQERESKETLSYRLTVCPELCLGIFSTTPTPQDPATIPSYPTALPADSSTPNRKSVLIAMIIATKTTTSLVTDTAMQIPQKPIQDGDTRGHKEQGGTICVWSLGVLPAYQRKGLGKCLLKSYQQRMETSGIASRIALIAHQPLVGLYESVGFQHGGDSDVKFAGGGWKNLTYDFTPE